MITEYNEYKIISYYLNKQSIHPPISPWAQRPSVSNAVFTTCLHSSRSWAILLRVCISLTSSSHSLLGLPRSDVPSTIPNITFFTSLWSSILHMCPNKFSFLSMMSWMIFLVLPTRPHDLIIRNFLLSSYLQDPSIALHFKWAVLNEFFRASVIFYLHSIYKIYKYCANKR